MDTSIGNLGEGLYWVGVSARLQRAIGTFNKIGHGGIEYLFSVPGLIGEAAVMNAGRDKENSKSIFFNIYSPEISESIYNGSRHLKSG